MEKQKFKIGDRVRFKSWSRMVKEYGIEEDECISLPNGVSFVSGMKHLCGTYATISEITNQHGDDRCLLTNFTTNGDTNWAYSPEMFVRARTRKKKVEDDSLDAIKYAIKPQAIMLPKDNSEDILDTLEEIKDLLEKLVEQKQPTFVELLKDFLKK